MQLAYENANAACCTAIQPHKGQTDLAGYIHLCAEIGQSYTQMLRQGFLPGQGLGKEGQGIKTFGSPKPHSNPRGLGHFQ